MKRILLTILAIILCLAIFSSCSPKDNEDTRQIVVSSRGNGSDIEGIQLYASISDTPVFDIDFDVENPSITFHWINDTDNDFSYPLLQNHSVLSFFVSCKGKRDGLVGLISGHSSDPFFLSSVELTFIVYLKI